ncbi:MAG: hypothetical protein K9J06_07965 [Flavobacteriales bacterium]|nr:hypothetical protein [Flavobacteriales bacterium]
MSCKLLLRKAIKLQLLLVVLVHVGLGHLTAQPVPPAESNIPFLVTFGPKAAKSYGDDDYSQVFFLSIPVSETAPIYIRVFDPDCGGEHDELNGPADTKVKFSIYGGKEAYSHKDARQNDPIGNYKSGTLLDSKSFDSSEKYDNQWYSFGPFDPKQGEKIDEFNSYIFKIVADGIEGNDGNLYRYFFSRSSSVNIAIEGANAFSYEWTFRMPTEAAAVSHLYPYVTDDVISIQQYNFDWDDDGVIKIISYEKKGEWVKMSNESDWVTSQHTISASERNSSLDIQFAKIRERSKRNNNVGFSVKNQYGQFMPFYSIPIGGVQKFKYDLNLIDRLREGERHKGEKVYK